MKTEPPGPPAAPSALTCPACGKSNAPAAPACRRCGCDFTLLNRATTAATAHLLRAENHLRAGRPRPGLAAATTAWTIRHTPKAARLAFVASVLLREHPTALRWHARATSNEPAQPPTGQFAKRPTPGRAPHPHGRRILVAATLTAAALATLAHYRRHAAALEDA